VFLLSCASLYCICYADQQIASVRVWQDSVDYSGTSMAYITPNSPNTAKTTTSGNSDSTTGNGSAQQPYYTPYAGVLLLV
jgi:hypothetical protein